MAQTIKYACFSVFSWDLHWWAKNIMTTPASYAVGRLHAAKTAPTCSVMDFTRHPKMPCGIWHHTLAADPLSPVRCEVEPAWITLVPAHPWTPSLWVMVCVSSDCQYALTAVDWGHPTNFAVSEDLQAQLSGHNNLAVAKIDPVFTPELTVDLLSYTVCARPWHVPLLQDNQCYLLYPWMNVMFWHISAYICICHE